jgi:hypothetical protein
MSRRNGDRARFDRQHTETIEKRARSRKLRKALQERAAGTEPLKPIVKNTTA